MIPYIDFEPSEAQIARETKRLSIAKIAKYIKINGEEPTDITPFQTLTETEIKNLKRTLWAMQNENEPIIPVQPNDEIWYTSTDGNIVTPYDSSAFNVNIVSNTYENERGVIKFDGDLTSIGVSAFLGCYNLALTSLPDGVTSIGLQAFFKCTNLALTSLPEGVTNIGHSAFLGCTNLALSSFPDGVTNIGTYAFLNCTSLPEIMTYNGTMEQWNAIEKIDGWHEGASVITIRCTNGDITLTD